MNLAKKFMAGFATFLVLLTPLSASASSVQIESAAMIGNVTAGDTQYHKSVNAKVDEVVKIQVWYHNKENADSGKVAQNLKVKIDVPTKAGKSQVFTSTTSADNANTVVDTATANLSLDNAHLEYIPGSAMWRHNKGTNDAPNWVTDKISDQVTNGGVVLENEQPCFNFEATVTILARVKASGLSVVKQVRKVGETTWTTSDAAQPGDTLEYMISFKNEGNTTLKDVIFADNMPAHVTYVPGSTKLKNGLNPNGVTLKTDNITKGGIIVGDYAPGAVAYVMFQAKVDPNLTVGCHDLQNVAGVKATGVTGVENYASTKVCVNQPTPTPTPTPATPAGILPQTGAEVALGGIGGSAGIGYALTAYRKSKRGLVSALRNVR